MDLRNLSSTPSLDIQRRPSLSSLSSTSGYNSSSYNGGNVNGNGQSNGNVNGTNNNNRRPWGDTINDVTPWVEQQKQQQNKVGIEVDKKELNSKNSNLSSTITNMNDLIDDDDIDDDDEDLIPTAIVIKNIPFAIKKEQLLDVMTKLNLPLPYAFNYHFDNGVFRGLAFANFTSTDETSSVVNLLNGREIGGRKLRVEYKKMLPAQERERIEREKREKRGQLEEQHRSASNASLASLISGTSTTAATKNLSVNGNTNSSSQERMFINYPNGNLSTIPSDINFNDLETLELFSQLIVFKDDNSKVNELAYSPNLTISQRKILTNLCNYLNLLELYDNGLIVIRRKPGQVFQVLNSTSSNLENSNSMMNLNQMNGNQQNGLNHPELLRSQSQSALPLPRLRQQSTGPINNFPQYQPNQSQPSNGKLYSNIQPFGLYPQNSGGLLPQLNSNVLRGRQYDMRTPPLNLPNSTPSSQPNNTQNNSGGETESSTPTNANATLSSANSPTPANSIFKGPTPSQPSTPLPSDINSRFAPFSNQNNVSLPSLNNEFDVKFNSLNLYENSSGIWGPK